MEIKEKVQEIFREVFENDDLVIQDSTSASDIEEWDSLNHINLIVSMEKEFKIKFALGELDDLKNVGEMLELIKKKVAAK